MALIICNDCGKEISDVAKSCPNCGAPNKKKNKSNILKEILNFVMKRKTITILIGIIIILLAVIVVILNKNNEVVKEEVVKIDLKEVYDNIKCNSTYCNVASDGSYLEVDTNPYDIDDFYSETAMDYIKEANIKLGFNESLYNKMGKTRALDGTLTDENDLIQVSWTYHPDNGLAVTYSIKNTQNIKQQEGKAY